MGDMRVVITQQGQPVRVIVTVGAGVSNQALNALEARVETLEDRPAGTTSQEVIDDLLELSDPLGDRSYTDQQDAPQRARLDALEALPPLAGFQYPAPGAVLRTLSDRLSDSVSVMDFGAINDGTLHKVSEWLSGGPRSRGFATLADIQAAYPSVGSLDDSIDGAAIVCAAKWCANTRRALRVPGGAGYYVNKSLDLTRNYNYMGVAIIGGGRSNTQIIINLDEPYPAIDFTNGKRCSLYGVYIRSLSTSLDTALILVAETDPSGANLMEISHCEIRSDSLNAKAAVVAVSADQLHLDWCGVVAAGPSAETAFIDSKLNRLGVVSKFRTIIEEDSDLTYLLSTFSQYLCSGGPAFWVEDYSELIVMYGYFATYKFSATGASSTATSMVRLRSNNRFIQPTFVGCRTENQGNAPDVAVFEIMDTVYNVFISGTLGGPGGLFKGPGKLYGGKVHVAGGPKLFGDMGPVVDAEFYSHAGANVLGTLTPDGLAQSANITFSGRVGNRTAIQQYLGHVPGLCIRAVSGDTGGGPAHESRALARVIFPTTDAGAPTSYRHAWAGACGNAPAPAAYVGGSGPQELFSVSCPNAVLAQPSGSVVNPAVSVEIDCKTVPGWAVGDTLSLTLTQGATTIELGSLSGFGGACGVSLRVRLRAYASNSCAAVVEIHASPAAGGSPVAARDTNTLPGMTRISASPFVLGVCVDSAQANPLGRITYDIHS